MKNENTYVKNWINGKLDDSNIFEWIDKHDPHTGEVICKVPDSTSSIVDSAVMAAKTIQEEWSKKTPVLRGKILFEIVKLMNEKADVLAKNIALETGKPLVDAEGEVSAAIMQGEFFAGEGMRLYGKTLTSSQFGKYSSSIRQPHGIVGLIIPANTPIANIAWKVFPALICGNTIVLKASEDAPTIALIFAEIAKEAGLPDGVLNIIQGGKTAGESIVNNNLISLISFTGSTLVGKYIAESAGKRLARVSLELGGKNPMIICDDADIEQAIYWTSLSSFSNAGQRCAAASRILIFEQVYEDFVEKLVLKTKSLKLGTAKGCDLGPVINLKQYENILNAINSCSSSDGRILCGGKSSTNFDLQNGYYIEPTLIEIDDENCSINKEELFGPVATIQKVIDIEQALRITNNSEFGLTAAIHTKDVDRAMWFAQNAKVGTVNVNIGTYGSEPHMPFGGFGSSGNGTREPGVEALDVYSELKNISFLTRGNLI